MQEQNVRNENWRLSTVVFFLTLIFFLPLSVLPLSALAEEVVHFGKTFPVEKISSIDADTQQIRLFGVETIVGKESMPTFVVEQYLEKKVSYFSLEELFRFIERAQFNNLPTLARKCFVALPNHPDFSQDTLVDFLAKKEPTASQIELYKTMLLKEPALASHEKVVAVLAFYIAQKDVRWLKTKGVRFIYLKGGAIKSFFESRFLAALEQVDIEQAAKIKELVASIFGTSDSFYKRLHVHLNRVRAGLRAIESLNAEAMFSFMELAHMKGKFSAVLSKVIVNSVHTAAASALGQGDTIRALTLLSWLDVDWRTPRTHQLVIESLEKVKAEDREAIFGARIESFLRFLAKKDEEVRGYYIEFLGQHIEQSATQEEFVQVRRYLEKVLEIQKDPSKINDSLRVSAALAYAKSGRIAEARRLYHERQTFASPLEYLTLLLNGVILDRTILICLVLIPVLFFAWFILRRKGSARRMKVEDEDLEYDIGEESRRPLFSKLAMKNRDPLQYNYRMQLQKFGLAEDADLKAIKQAYRHAVKKVHPDTNPNQDSSAHELFLELSASYEKILRLRKRMGYEVE